MELTLMGAKEAAEQIREGYFSAEDLVSACLEQIERLEDQVGAWTYLDPDYALQQARAADMARQKGQPPGPLHGVPVGIKDIIDTSDMPTEDGTVLHSGRQPTADATEAGPAACLETRDCCPGRACGASIRRCRPARV